MLSMPAWMIDNAERDLVRKMSGGAAQAGYVHALAAVASYFRTMCGSKKQQCQNQTPASWQRILRLHKKTFPLKQSRRPWDDQDLFHGCMETSRTGRCATDG